MRLGALSIRALKVGVRVNATISETKIAQLMVTPNEFIKRPTMPLINATGKKTATKLKVVAKTANPISRVPSIAA